MKIAVSSTGKDKDARIDGRFGRCAHFVLYDLETKSYTTVTNEAKLSSGGAGVQAGQTVANHGVVIVLTGNVGPNAFQALHAAKIEVVTGAAGLVSQAVSDYLDGKYDAVSGPTVTSHYGM